MSIQQEKKPASNLFSGPLAAGIGLAASIIALWAYFFEPQAATRRDVQQISSASNNITV